MQGNIIVGHEISVGLEEELGMRDSEKLVGSVEYSPTKVRTGALTRTKLVTRGQDD